MELDTSSIDKIRLKMSFSKYLKLNYYLIILQLVYRNDNLNKCTKKNIQKKWFKKLGKMREKKKYFCYVVISIPSYFQTLLE